MNSPEAARPDAPPSQRRRRLLLLAAVCAAGAIAWAVWWQLAGRWTQSTDDAYVGGTVVQVTAEVAGTVRTIHPRETQSVTAGQVLVELDPADARITLDAALAELGSAVRQVGGTYPQRDRVEAVIRARESDLARARDDLQRRQSVAAGGAVSAEELAHAREVVAAADAAVRAAREELRAATALTSGTQASNHPSVLLAAARVRAAALTLDRMQVTAPVDGVVARKAVQVGQRVAAGSPLLTLVPMRGLWVDANFKEGQLRSMRIGQPVELVADLYGDAIVYHGRITGIAPGTGAAFALLPAQNASGNWIKIVQRVPVRIELDPAEVERHALRIGLSMHATVDLHDTSGPVLGLPMSEAAATLPARAGRDERVEALISRTIEANSVR